MPYSAEISRSSPAAFLFLLDQSASMQEPFGGAEEKGDAAPSKARVLADVMNRLLQNLVLRCAKEDGVRDYFYVGVVGYGARVQPLVRPTEALGTALDLIPISHLAEHPLRLEERRKQVPDGAGGLVEQRVRFPVWFDPEARNGTPMCQALDLATQMVRRWIDLHPHGFPPIVLNITDGEATDGDPLRYARTLCSFGTDDGEVLLFNVHLSSVEAMPVELPDRMNGLPDAYAEQLFQMSSVLPFSMRAAAEQEGYAVSMDARGFVFNADPVALVRFLEVGTRPSTLR
ncbi:VWA domain-containing protein [Rhodocaloribacter litoris]|uniref:vWA domain-containing protein n=1 Tax=Rhodocaloribacter litoris TaxID=2558931 RepID=UPI00141D9383|nr:vWA domain-containing protein [Rhodocaloribacter litoris]QXD16615.1 VWA domain-containing protein [Rhodocaloribacter litoris]